MVDVATATSEGKPRKVYAMGEGLYLVVTQRGNKSWCYRQGTTYKALGAWPDLDEVAARVKINTADVGDYSLDKWVNNYLAYLVKMKRSPKTILQYEYAARMIGEGFKALRIDTLQDLDVTKVKPLFTWMMKNKTEYTSNLAYPFLGAVFKYMNSSGIPINNPFPNLKKSMVLEGEYKSDGLDSIKDPAIMKEFIKKLKEVKNLPTARNCVLAIAYLPLRPTEMSTLKFSDILEDGTLLYVPPERNKTRKHLYFPVTPQLRAIIKEQKKISGGEYVFPNRIGGDGYVKRDALTRVVEQIGYKGQLDIHGLRHTFRTIADEHLKLDRLMLEVVLGHNIGTRIEHVYNRSTYIDQKLEVLTKWNNWIDQ